jgi:hypothetical protein
VAPLVAIVLEIPRARLPAVPRVPGHPPDRHPDPLW